MDIGGARGGASASRYTCVVTLDIKLMGEGKGSCPEKSILWGPVGRSSYTRVVA